MKWTQQEYDAYQTRRAASRAVAQPPVRHEPVGEEKRENKVSPRHVVRICSFRRRLLDSDNLIGGSKYFIDGLRHAGLIPDDRPQDITLEVCQEKVKRKEDERTEIEITPLQ